MPPAKMLEVQYLHTGVVPANRGGSVDEPLDVEIELRAASAEGTRDHARDANKTRRIRDEKKEA